MKANMSLSFTNTFRPNVEPNSTAPSFVTSPMSSSNGHVTLQARPASYTIGTRLSWGLKRPWRGAGHPPSYIADIVNTLKYTFVPALACHGVTLTFTGRPLILTYKLHRLYYKLPSNCTSNWWTCILDFCGVFSDTTSYYFSRDSALDPQYM